MSVVTVELSERIGATFGLAPRDGWWRALDRAVDVVATQNGWDVDAAIDHAVRDRDLLQELAGMLTIGETHFFRHPEHFDLITDRVAAVSGRRTMHVWSAGCATGEEPYSVAIAVARRFGPLALQRLAIAANDLAPIAVERARAGTYSDWSFRGTPREIISTWFEPEGARQRLIESMRESVTFSCAGIEEQAARIPPASIDVILCRNVTIYLDPEATARVHAAFARALRPDGYLLLAPADPAPPRDRFALDTAAPGAYRTLTAAPGERPNRRRARGEVPAAGVNVQRSASVQRAQPTVDPLPAAEGEALRLADTVGNSTMEVESVDVEGVRAVADRGDLARAVRLATALIQASPAAVPGYLLRGQVRLDQKRPGDAIADLRRVAFLAPGHRLGRFWYAVALMADGSRPLAHQQLVLLRSQLISDDPTGILEDERTSIGELLAAVDGLLEEAP